MSTEIYLPQRRNNFAVLSRPYTYPTKIVNGIIHKKLNTFYNFGLEKDLFEAQNIVNENLSFGQKIHKSKKSKRKSNDTSSPEISRETEIVNIATKIEKLDYELSNEILKACISIKNMKVKTIQLIYEAIKDNGKITENFPEFDILNTYHLLYFLNTFSNNQKTPLEAIRTGIDIVNIYKNNSQNIPPNEDESYFRNFISIVRKFHEKGNINVENISEPIEIFNLYKNYKKKYDENADINKLYYQHNEMVKKHKINLSFHNYMKFKNIGFVNTNPEDFINSLKNYQKVNIKATPADFIDQLQKYNEFIEKLSENNNWLPEIIAKIIHSSDDIQKLLINDRNILNADKFLSGRNLGELVVKKNIKNDKGKEIKVFDEIKITRNGNIFVKLTNENPVKIKYFINAFERLAERTYPSLKKMQHEKSIKEIIAEQLQDSSTERYASGYFSKSIKDEGKKISFNEFYTQNKELIIATIRKINNTFGYQNLSIHSILRTISRNLSYERITKNDLINYINGKPAEKILNLLNAFALPTQEVKIGLKLLNGEIIKGFAIEKALDGESPGISIYTATENSNGSIKDVYFYTYNGDASLRTFYKVEHMPEPKNQTFMEIITAKRNGRSKEIKLN